MEDAEVGIVRLGKKVSRSLLNTVNDGSISSHGGLPRLGRTSGTPRGVDHGGDSPQLHQDTSCGSKTAITATKSVTSIQQSSNRYRVKIRDSARSLAFSQVSRSSDYGRGITGRRDPGASGTINGIG